VDRTENFIPWGRNRLFLDELRKEQQIKYFGKGVHSKYGGPVDCHQIECCGPVTHDTSHVRKRLQVYNEASSLDMADVINAKRRDRVRKGSHGGLFDGDDGKIMKEMLNGNMVHL